MTSDGLRLLQDLRRSLLDPPRQLRPRTVTAIEDADTSQNVSAIALHHHEAGTARVTFTPESGATNTQFEAAD
jgi:hypothetical protein